MAKYCLAHVGINGANPEDAKKTAEMFEALDTGGGVSSTVENAIASHLVAFAAEASRLKGGELVGMQDFEREYTEPALRDIRSAERK